jgi:hypothetical protein
VVSASGQDKALYSLATGTSSDVVQIGEGPPLRWATGVNLDVFLTRTQRGAPGDPHRV